MHKHKIGSLPYQLISLNSYDALGRAIEKRVGGTDVSGAAAFQEVNYTYNVRNWLTDINNASYLPQAGAPIDLFALKINYTTVEDDINGSVIPLYNGNISEIFWRTSSDNIKRKYGYTYDYQNRLRDAWYQLPNSSTPEYFSYNERLSYDRNGNILSLQRNGEVESATTIIAIDDLSYDYDNGNKLLNVTDAESHPAGFNDGNTSLTQDDFEYDTYGNMILDRNKGITAITYNHLNLPKLVTFGASGMVEYLYDAAGIKLKKTVVEGSITKVTNYMDGFQYTAGDLDFFPHAEGYVKVVPPSGLGGQPSYHYVFNYTDHLGNIRLRYTLDPQTSELTILEEDHYYPFGLKQKGYNTTQSGFSREPGGTIELTPINPFLGDSYQYKFGGKEYQDELGLDWYDVSARNYDPALGRWMNIDPLAEYMWRHSPYAYAFNNPIYYIDPDGNMPSPVSSGLSIGASSSLGDGDFGFGDTDKCPSGDCDDAVNKGNPIQLAPVYLTNAKSKDKAAGIHTWGAPGVGYQDRGRHGPAEGELNYGDLPMGGLQKSYNTIFDIVKSFFKKWADWKRIGDKMEELSPNESTMENKEKETVKAPEEDMKTINIIKKDSKMYKKINASSGAVSWAYERSDTTVNSKDEKKTRQLSQKRRMVKLDSMINSRTKD